MNSKLQKLFEEAVSWIHRSNTDKIRVVSHYDADGISAASILFIALYREGFDVHVSLMRNPFTDGLERVRRERNEFIIFSDMGSGQIPIIKDFDSRIIILDHHQPLDHTPIDNILEINANLCDIKGDSEACGASLSYVFSSILNSKNRDLIPLALTGITGDKQYIGGIKGFNKEIVEEAVDSKQVTMYKGIKSIGETIEDALYYTVDPYYPGISGNRDGIKHLLMRLHIDPDQNLETLSEIQKKKLYSYLLLILMKTGCTPIILDTVIRERYSSQLTHGEIEGFSDIIDACGKGNQRDLGFAVCIGDEEAYRESLSFHRDYNQLLLDELQKLELQGAEERKYYRYFYSEDSSRSGVIAGIAVNYLFDDKKPLISLVRHKDELHISSRGNQRLTEKGLNLGLAMREIAMKVDGHGGGHKIAAGATIPLDKEEFFLEELDDILRKQIG
ncbi:MAG: hypothetical protein DRN12_01920 [Thermoplasmata archaeon]|nr:MAG: hypothetical protein DRN12_01920 [Thermoplasmata archaeon]